MVPYYLKSANGFLLLYFSITFVTNIIHSLQFECNFLFTTRSCIATSHIKKSTNVNKPFPVSYSHTLNKYFISKKSGWLSIVVYPPLPACYRPNHGTYNDWHVPDNNVACNKDVCSKSPISILCVCMRDALGPYLVVYKTHSLLYM